MNHSFKFFCVLIFMLFITTLGMGQEPQLFTRTDTIPAPQTDLNVGGAGNMISGVDLDGDGKTEIYWVNDNWNDTPDELIPRIYKMEFDTTWKVVWSAVAPIEQQNTWPALTWGDLDKDGKKEIIWGVVNFIATDLNPARILVYEQGTGDAMGVLDGETYKPNSLFSITDQDNQNIRPTRFYLSDIDGDDTTEVIFNDRAGASSGWYFGVCSVDKIPDNGDGSEIWKVEANGLTVGLTDAENKYDLAVIDSLIFLPDEVKCDRIKYSKGLKQWSLLPPDSGFFGGAAPFNSLQVLDIDGNGVEEMVGISYWNNYKLPGETPAIWLYEAYDVTTGKEVLMDTLKGTKLFDMTKYLPAGTQRGVGGAWADLDKNGKKDFVFGSRNATPNGALFRIEYMGIQDQVANVDNWKFSVIDSSFAAGGVWNIINIANIDQDKNMEILYTSSIPAGTFPEDGTQPIVVIEYEIPPVIGPWKKIELPYAFSDVFDTGLSAPNQPVVDKFGRVWLGSTGSLLKVVHPDGTVDPITSVVDTLLTSPSVVTSSGSRGITLDNNGNVIFAKTGWVIRINVETGVVMNSFPFVGSTGSAASPLAPATDDQGYIYVGFVVGITPIKVIDPATFTLTQEIILSPAAGYARGMEVSSDGTTLYACDLTENIHPTYIYKSTDFINYPLSDSIYTDDQGDPIFSTQVVYVNEAPDLSLWYSHDNAYADVTNPALHQNNSLVMFNFETHEYGYLYMPESEGYLGVWGASFTQNMDTIYAGSRNGNKVYRFTRTGSGTGEPVANGMPLKFELSQNYPNPFNPITTINFSIAKAGKTKLLVYDILGRKVATLFDGNMPMGRFIVQFDASRLASGTYIYELIAPNNTRISKKMTVLK